MSLPVQPLLSLVEQNANGLKLLLKNYIDYTVDNQFDQLKNSIVQMIATGQIGPQSNDSAFAYTQTTFPSGQSNIDHTNSSIVQHTNDHLTITPDQITSTSSSLVSTITTPPQIKEECLEDSSSTIPINVQCNDAPNDEDKEQSNNADIEVNHAQNGQCSIDEVKEEYDDDDENENEGEYMSYNDECEDCANGICQLNQSHLVGVNDYTNNDAPNVTDNDYLENIEISSSESMVQGTDSQDEFVHEAFDDDGEDQLLPTSQQNNDHSTASIVQSTMHSANDQLTTDQITLPPTNQLIATKESNGKVKNDKRKFKSNSRKAVKKVRKQNVEEFHQDEEEEEEGKLQVVTLKVNCTEDGCKTFLNSVEMWKEHLSSVYGQMPYKHLHDNARHNQHGQTEYPCTKCEVVCNSQRSLILHWRMYHLSGKYQCSTCTFVANFRSEVHNHQHNHRSSKFQCTQQGCNQAFKFMVNLEIHQRIHTGERPYRCTWHNCEVSFNQIGSAIQHVRMKHFRLPRTVRKQKELKILDQRDPKVFIQVSRG